MSFPEAFCSQIWVLLGGESAKFSKVADLAVGLTLVVRVFIDFPDVLGHRLQLCFEKNSIFNFPHLAIFQCRWRCGVPTRVFWRAARTLLLPFGVQYKSTYIFSESPWTKFEHKITWCQQIYLCRPLHHVKVTETDDLILAILVTFASFWIGVSHVLPLKHYITPKRTGNSLNMASKHWILIRCP